MDIVGSVASNKSVKVVSVMVGGNILFRAK